MNLDFYVTGRPAPQGSKRHVGRGILVESSKHVKPWREAVRSTAVSVLPEDWTVLDGPVMLVVTFYALRPKSHYRTGRNAHLLREDAPLYPTSAPDLSKLVRSTEDALTDAGVWKDDARVVKTVSEKRYCDFAIRAAGAFIHVRPTGEDLQ